MLATMKKQFNVRLPEELVTCIRVYAETNGMTIDAAASKIMITGMIKEELDAQEKAGPWADQRIGRKMRLAWRALLAKQGEPT
jgi:hypothetical protein